MTRPRRTATDNLAESIAINREVAERQMSNLNAAVERTTQNVDRAVEEIKQSVDRIEHQVGVMSERSTLVDIKIERLADQIRELTNAVNGHLRVAEKQADNITELTKLVAIQANTVAALINRTA